MKTKVRSLTLAAMNAQRVAAAVQSILVGQAMAMLTAFEKVQEGHPGPAIGSQL